MRLDNPYIVPVVERTLHMSVDDRQQWCLDWAVWLWQQQVEIAVYRAKQSRP